MINYLAAQGDQVIILGDAVLGHLSRHRQLGPNDKEAGGQLFARFEDSSVRIEVATGPRPADSRGRFSFIPHRWSERREIQRMHAEGLHYVGDWHTHPENVPTPSGTDINSIVATYRSSRHALAGLLLVIAGRVDAPEGLYVGIADANGLSQLSIAGLNQPHRSVPKQQSLNVHSAVHDVE